MKSRARENINKMAKVSEIMWHRYIMFESFCSLACHDSEAKWKYGLSVAGIMMFVNISICNWYNDVSATVVLGWTPWAYLKVMSHNPSWNEIIKILRI